MKEILNALNAALCRREDTVLAVITESRGSSPRKSGAAMLCGREGRLAGTIGGGISEHLACGKAAALIASQSSEFAEYELYPNGPSDIGARCGGEARVYFAFISGLLTPKGFAGDAISMLEKPSAFLVFPLYEGEGGPKLSLTEDDSVQERGYFSIPLMYPGFVYIAGAGHISRELCPLLDRLGFRSVVIDDRPEFARAEFFPEAVKVIRASYEELGRMFNITRYDYGIALTSGHSGDFKAARALLSTRARYIGVIGSREKIAFVRGRLINEAGISPEEIDAPRFHAPVGIDIHSETPSEVALSIAAELVKIRAEATDRV